MANSIVFVRIVVISAFTVLFLIAFQNTIFPYKNKILNVEIPVPKRYHGALQQLEFNSTDVKEKENTLLDSEPEVPFSKAMSFFNWKDFQNAMSVSDTEKIQNLSQSLINLLTPYIIMAPNVPINESCQPPPLQTPSCEKPAEANLTRKVGVLFQFGFDADILEIHLNELDDLVDKFFILESTRAHYKALKKPLIWELVKTQPRFEKFVPKVVHSVIDDTEISAEELKIKSSKYNADYGVEQFQEKIRWENFLIWNNATNFFGDDDILGFGDVDEIPSRENIHYLKKCGTPEKSVDIGIWYPLGSIDQAFKTDWPVPHHPYTYGDPTYYTFKNAKAYQTQTGKVPTRRRGKSVSFLLGGMHMSFHGYLPYAIAKRLTIIERDRNTFLEVANFYDELQNSTLFHVERKYAQEIRWSSKDLKRRLVKLEQLDKTERAKIVKLPWFYDCNRDRYPTWEKKHDSRVS